MVRIKKRRIKISSVWSVFTKLAKLIHGNTCCTCGKENLEGSDCQGGHFKPKKAFPAVRFWINNVHPQCTGCNFYRQGMEYEHSLHIIKAHGQDALDEICEHMHKSVHLTQADLHYLKDTFQTLLKKLETKKMTTQEAYQFLTKNKIGLCLT